MYDTTRPALVVIAHGSRDPRHAATVAALCTRLRALRPELRVEAGYLDFHPESVPRVLERLYSEGIREVTALPLLLTRAFHAKSDIPGVLGGAVASLPGLAVHQAPVLGPHPLLLGALERRLGETGLRQNDRRSTGVVLASAGSTDPEAIAVIAEIAREWRRTSGWCAVRPAFASASLPRPADAVRALRADGVGRVALAPYVIAPGFFADRMTTGAREAGADFVAPALGSTEELATLLALRYDETLAGLAPPVLSA